MDIIVMYFKPARCILLHIVKPNQNTMKKLLTIAILALSASFAHAGSCGGNPDKDKEGEKKGATASSQTLACGKKADADKDGDSEKSGFITGQLEVAGNCGKGGDSDEPAKEGKLI